MANCPTSTDANLFEVSQMCENVFWYLGVSKLLVASVEVGYNEAQRHIREIDQEKRGVGRSWQ